MAAVSHKLLAQQGFAYTDVECHCNCSNIRQRNLHWSFNYMVKVGWLPSMMEIAYGNYYGMYCEAAIQGIHDFRDLDKKAYRVSYLFYLAIYLAYFCIR